MESIWKALSFIILIFVSFIGFRWLWFKRLRARNYIEKLNRLAKYHNIHTVDDAYKVLDQTRNTLNSM